MDRNDKAPNGWKRHSGGCLETWQDTRVLPSRDPHWSFLPQNRIRPMVVQKPNATTIAVLKSLGIILPPDIRF